MLIVDEIKAIAKRVGVEATGSTIQAVVLSFKAGLDAKDKVVADATPAIATFAAEDGPNKPKRTKKKAE